MKNFVKLFGIITVIMIISISGCKGKNEGSTSGSTDAVSEVVPTQTQASSNSFNPNLPLAYSALLDLKQFNLDRLFMVEYFSNENFNTVVESKSIKGDTLDGSIMCSTNGTNVIRFRLIIKTDHSFNLNRLNSVIIDNLLTGQREEIKNTGTEQSAGEVLGALVGIIDILYDSEKLYK